MFKSDAYQELSLEQSLQELFILIECIIIKIENSALKVKAESNLQKIKLLSENFLFLSISFSQMPYYSLEREKWIEETLLTDYIGKDLKEIEPKAWLCYQRLLPKILDCLTKIYKALY